MPVLRRMGVSLLAAGLLAGCASNAQESAGSSGPHEVVYLSSGKAGPFYTQIAEGFQFGAGLVSGVTAEAMGPKSTDAVAQMKLLDEVVGKGITSVGISVPFSEINTDSITQAAAKGVRFLAVDTPPLPGSPVELFIGNDNEALGKQLADTVADQLGVGVAGKILVGSPRNGVPQLDARALGFRERLGERLPKVRVIGPLDTAEIPAAAAQNWDAVTKANKDALAFVSVGANASLLAGIRAKQKATWLAASFDIDQGALAAVKQGGLVVLSPEQFLKGAVAGKLQAQYVGQETKMPTGWIVIPGISITTKNVDEYIARDATQASRTAWYTAHLTELLGKTGPHVRPLEDAQQ